MDDNTLDLTCEHFQQEGWSVSCTNTNQVLSTGQPTGEDAWQKAAERLASVVSEMRKTLADL